MHPSNWINQLNSQKYERKSKSETKTRSTLMGTISIPPQEKKNKTNSTILAFHSIHESLVYFFSQVFFSTVRIIYNQINRMCGHLGLVVFDCLTISHSHSPREDLLVCLCKSLLFLLYGHKNIITFITRFFLFFNIHCFSTAPGNLILFQYKKSNCKAIQPVVTNH